METLKIPCRYYSQAKSVRKHGTGANKAEYYRCINFRKSFQLDYTYNVYHPGVKEQIVDMAMHNAGLRDTVSALKKLQPKQVISVSFDNAEIDLICEVDEQWLFVQNKENQPEFGMTGSQGLRGSPSQGESANDR